MTNKVEYLCNICQIKNATRYYCGHDLENIDLCNSCLFEILPFLFISIDKNKLKELIEVVKKN